MDDMKTQLGELQRSVDRVAYECHEISKKQEASAESHRLLHQEHIKLSERVERSERKLDVHLNDFVRQQEHNEIVHAHMTGSTLALRAEVQEFRAEFKEHDRTEEADRKDQTKALRETTRAIVVTGVTILLALLGLIAKLGWGV